MANDSETPRNQVHAGSGNAPMFEAARALVAEPSLQAFFQACDALVALEMDGCSKEIIGHNGLAFVRNVIGNIRSIAVDLSDIPDEKRATLLKANLIQVVKLGRYQDKNVLEVADAVAQDIYDWAHGNQALSDVQKAQIGQRLGSYLTVLEEMRPYIQSMLEMTRQETVALLAGNQKSGRS